MFSAVSVLTIQLIMNSLNIYYQFMLFRVSFPLVRFSRSPQPKLLIKYIIISWELPCCTSINLFIDVILKYVSVENQLELGQIGISPLSKTLRRIMQHSTVRSFYIIWSWKDHLASGLIEVTIPTLNI